MKLPPAIDRPAAAAPPPAHWPAPYVLAAAGVVLVLMIGGVTLIASTFGRSSSPTRAITKTTTNDPLAAVAFSCAGSTGLGTSAAPPTAYQDSIRVTRYRGFDRITIGFANGRPANAVLTTQAGARFQPAVPGPVFTLKGGAGALLTIYSSDGHAKYRGSRDIKTADPLVQELVEIEVSAGTVQWAIGLAASSCYRMAFFDNPTALVIDFERAP